MNLNWLMKGPLMWGVFGFAVVFFVCVFIWDLSAQQTEQIIRAEQSTQNHIEYAEDRIDEKCLALEPVALRDCIHKEIESARDHDRANQDLDAQQQMAFFTKLMAWITGGGLILGTVSIFVIYRTLSEMGRTNQIMRHDQRPWLSCDIVADGKISEFNFNNINVCDVTTLDVEITYQNHGRTPINIGRTFFKLIEGPLNIHETLQGMHTGERIGLSIVMLKSLYPSEKRTIQKQIDFLPESQGIITGGNYLTLLACTIYESEGGVRYYCDRSYNIDINNENIGVEVDETSTTFNLRDNWFIQAISEWQ